MPGGCCGCSTTNCGSCCVTCSPCDIPKADLTVAVSGNTYTSGFTLHYTGSQWVGDCVQWGQFVDAQWTMLCSGGFTFITVNIYTHLPPFCSIANYFDSCDNVGTKLAITGST